VADAVSGACSLKQEVRILLEIDTSGARAVFRRVATVAGVAATVSRLGIWVTRWDKAVYLWG